MMGPPICCECIWNLLRKDLLRKGSLSQRNRVFCAKESESSVHMLWPKWQRVSVTCHFWSVTGTCCLSHADVARWISFIQPKVSGYYCQALFGKAKKVWIGADRSTAVTLMNNCRLWRVSSTYPVAEGCQNTAFLSSVRDSRCLG